jgi:cytochrome c heme-lyase
MKNIPGSLGQTKGPTTGQRQLTFSCLVQMGQTASTPTPPPPAPAVNPAPAKCPVDHSTIPKSAPMASATSSTPAQCPVQHDAAPLNPRNQMPDLPQHAIYQNQVASLSTERITSSIPRDRGSNWDYPSPQQFYNALVRKGWETPEEHVETMVEIHNFLNEQAWNEVLRWESRHGESVLQLLCLPLHAHVNVPVRKACN